MPRTKWYNRSKGPESGSEAEGSLNTDTSRSFPLRLPPFPSCLPSEGQGCGSREEVASATSWGRGHRCKSRAHTWCTRRSALGLQAGEAPRRHSILVRRQMTESPEATHLRVPARAGCRFSSAVFHFTVFSKLQLQRDRPETESSSHKFRALRCHTGLPCSGPAR